MADPIQDALSIQLPEDLQAALRVIHVAPHRQSTFRLMHDPHDGNRDKWFKQGGGMPRVTDGNEVKALIRGGETYAEMHASIKAAAASAASGRNAPSYTYIAGWNLDGNAWSSLTLKEGDPSSTLEKTLTSASARGMEIRAVIWANGPRTPFDIPFPKVSVEGINQIASGRGIVDWKTAVLFPLPNPIGDPHIFHIGAHHMKIVMTRAAGQVHAYLGGIDIDTTRLDKAGTPGWEDVHCRLRGPAADEVVATFTQRWDDYLNSPDPDSNHDQVRPTFANIVERDRRNAVTAPGAPASRPVDGQVHRQSVQVCRTFHSKLYDRIPPGNRAGEKSIRTMVLHAIGQAEKFIYIEDQYLFSMDVSNALKGAIAKGTFRALVILIPIDGAVDGELAGQAGHRRALFLNNLINSAGGEKVKVFAHRTRFVHSKIYLIDDKLAIIGSANCNRRGMEHDSEISAAIFDRSSDKEECLHLARRLRMRLWATHLNLAAAGSDPSIPSNTQAEFVEQADGVGSIVHWLRRPASARIEPYVVNDNIKAAIDGLEAEKEKMRKSIRDSKTIPALLKPKALGVLETILMPLPSNPVGVDRSWNQLFDPGDP